MNSRVRFYQAISLAAALVLPHQLVSMGAFDDSLDSILFDEQIFFSQPSASILPVSTIVNVLNDLGVVSLLEQNFFKKTFLLNQRNLIDYPLFNGIPWQHPDCKTIGYQFFFQAMPAMYFSSNCSKITAYLNTASSGFAERLQAIFEGIQEQLNPDFDPQQIVEILALVEHFTVQERRLGVMFNYEQKLNEWRIRWRFPYYLRERNHFTSPQVRDAINQILDPTFGTPTQDEQDIFAEEHIIADQSGIGDFRFEFDRTVCCFPDFKARMGFLVTLPTAFTFTAGLIGTRFKPPVVRPLLDIQGIANMAANTMEIPQEAQNYFLSVLDNLSSILLDTRLGDRHFGIGWHMRTKSRLYKFIQRPWAENIKLRSRMMLELYLPAVQRRYFIQPANIAEFTSRNFADENQANANYNFIIQTLTNRLFPFTADAIVYPGIIFQTSSRAIYDGEKYSFMIGSDMYVRSPERITEVKCPDICNIAIDRAQAPTCYQSKLFAGAAMRYSGPTFDWIFSLNADTTQLSSGIGSDYMITFNIDVNF